MTDAKKDEKDKKQEVVSLDSGNDSGPLKLVAKDGKTSFEVDKKHAFVSNLVKTSLENDTSASSLDIPGVSGPILEKVVEYVNHHKGVEPPIIEKPLRSKVLKDVCQDKWDAEYIDKIGENRQNLYDLILAANYMDIKSLLHLGCAKVASLIKGQPLEKIKEILDPKGGSSSSSTTEKKEEKKDEKKEEKEKKDTK